MRLSVGRHLAPRPLSDKVKKPGTRREAREATIQFLFSHDLNDDTLPDQCDHFWELRTARPKVRDFAKQLIAGIFEHKEQIDQTIEGASKNYSLTQLTAVDRCLLRLATYEILFRDDIPAAVTINEAIEIAKRFGSNESAGFVNGVIDRIEKEHRGNHP